MLFFRDLISCSSFDFFQAYLFDSCVVPIIDEVLQGYSCTVFAYGQTGTGKTYTMEGDYSRSTSEGINENAGIIPRAVNRIFNHLRNEHADSDEYSVRMSFLELYNEQLTDLLSADEDDLPIDAEWYAKGGKQYDVRKMAKAGIKPQAKSKLHIVDDGRRGVTVQNLEEMLVHSEEEVFSYVKRGFEKRQVAQTKCNDFSSRSHAIFTLTIHSKETTEDGEEIMKVGKLNLVDLAGSECIGRSGAKGKQRQEASVINRSLLTLGRVISALVEKQPHVPYRDSKLTRLLQDSLGGHTKTCIIATMSPASSCVEETLSTLDYAWRAKQIKNIPTANAKMTKNKMLSEFTSEIDQLQRMLHASREKNGIYLPQDTYDELTAGKKAADLRISELEELKVVQDEEIEKLQNSLKDLEEALEQSRQAHEKTKGQLKQTTTVLNQTADQLLDRRGECEEKGVLLFAHRESEKALHSQARDLVSELKGTVSDVRGLHAKKERQQQSEKQNLSRVEQFREDCRARLSSLKNQTNEFSSKQEASLQNLAQSIDEQTRTQLSQLGKAKDTLEKTKESFKQGLQSVDDKLKKQQKQAQQEGASLRHTSSKTSNAIQEELQQLQKQVAERVNDLNDILEKQQNLCSESSHRSVTVLKELNSSMSEFVKTYHGDLNKVKESTNSGFDTAVQTLVSQRIQLQAFEKSRKSSLEKAGNDLIQAVQQSVNKMIQDQAETTSDAVNSLNEKGNSAISTLDKTKGDVAEKIENSRNGVDDWSGALIEKIDTESKAREQDLSSLQESATSLREKHQSVQNSVEQSNSNLQGQNNNWLNTVESSVSRLGDKWNTTIDEVKQAQNQSEEELGQEFGNLRQSLVSTQEGLNAANQENKDSITKTQESNEVFGNFIGQWQSTENNKIDELVEKELEPCPPTGTTPGKRSYNVPSTLVCTSPHDRILERFRGHKSQRTKDSSDATLGGKAVVNQGDELYFNKLEDMPNPEKIEHAYPVQAPEEIARSIKYGEEGRAKPSLAPVSPSQPAVETPQIFKSKENVSPAYFSGHESVQNENNGEDDQWFDTTDDSPKETPKATGESEGGDAFSQISEQTNGQEGSRESTGSSTKSTSSSRSTTSTVSKTTGNVHKGPPTNTSSVAPKISSQRSTLTKSSSCSSIGTNGSNEEEDKQKNDKSGNQKDKSRRVTSGTASSRIPKYGRSHSKTSGSSSLPQRRQTRANAKRTGLSDASNLQQ